jgi:hypothetical protein
VEAFGTTGGKELHAEADFDITARMFEDAVQPASSPQLKARGQPILMADYPGLIARGSGWQTLEGGLGRTWHLFPDYDLSLIPSGPNKNLVIAERFQWVNSAMSTGALVAPGTYLSAALFPGDPFYNRQKGGKGFCRQDDMNKLRDEVHAHELIH